MVSDTVVWGPVSEWVSGIATSLAVAVALTFSLRAERTQREAQLASVYAWFELGADATGDQAGILWLVNNTEFPIYEWDVELSWTTGANARLTLGTGHAEHGLLPPGRHDFVLRPGEDGDLPANDASVAVSLRFRDAAGRQRKRESHPTAGGRGEA
jgi:hypothetical protein